MADGHRGTSTCSEDVVDDNLEGAGDECQFFVDTGDDGGSGGGDNGHIPMFGRRTSRDDLMASLSELDRRVTGYHDILYARRITELKAIHNQILRRLARRRQTWCFVYLHEAGRRSHIHVVHGCKQSGRCQCSFLRGYAKVPRIPEKSIKQIGTITFDYFRNLVEYFFRKRTGILYLQNFGLYTGRNDIRNVVVPEQRGDSQTEEGLVEAPSCSLSNLHSRHGERSTERDGSPHQTIGDDNIMLFGSSFDNDARCRDDGQSPNFRFKQKLLNYIMCHPCVPMSNVVETKDFVEQYGLLDNKIVQTCVTCAESLVHLMTFEEVEEYVLNKSKYGFVKCMFEATKCTFASLYYTITETKYLIHKLLNYQFDNDHEIYKFILLLWNWIRCQNGKKKRNPINWTKKLFKNKICNVVM